MPAVIFSGANVKALKSNLQLGSGGVIISDSSGALHADGRIRAGATSSALPGISFTDNTDVGLHHPGSNILEFVAGGFTRIYMRTDATQFEHPLRVITTGSSEGIPGYSFNSDTNTGMHGLADILYLVTGGTTRLKIENDKVNSLQPLQQDGVGVQLTENYLLGDDSTADTSVGNWAEFDDGAVTEPDDATGGSPTNITLSRTTTAGEVLGTGAGALKLARDVTASAQGEGISCAFSIPYGQRGKPQELKFKFKTDSTFVNSTLKAFIYDVTNDTVISVRTMDGGSGELYATGTYGTTFTGLWHAADDSTSYRLVFMIYGTDTTQYNCYFDDLYCGPLTQVSGYNNIFDQDFTPSWNNVTIGNGTQEFFYDRVGKLLHIHGALTFGSTTSFTGSVSMANPIANTTLTRVDSNLSNGIITLYDSDTGANREIGSAYIASGGIIEMLTGGITTVNATTPFTWATGDVLSVDLWFRVDEWVGSDTMSVHQADLRTLKIQSDISTASHATSGIWIDIAWTETKDTHNTFDGTTFTLPMAGTVYFTGMLGFAGNATGMRGVKLLVNGATSVPINQAASAHSSIETHLPITGEYEGASGDTIKVQGYQNSGSSPLNYSGSSYVHFRFVPDFSVFAVQGVYEYKSVELTSNTDTVSATTPVDVSGATLTLGPGTWDLGYQMSCYMKWASGTTTFASARIYMTDSSNNHVDGSAALLSVEQFDSDADEYLDEISRICQVTITEETTYKVRIECGAADTVYALQVRATGWTGALTDPDQESTMWARRVK